MRSTALRITRKDVYQCTFCSVKVNRLQFRHAVAAVGVLDSSLLTSLDPSEFVYKPDDCFRLFWAIGLVAMYALCAVAIYAVILFFLEMPAIISLDNSVSSIWTIPFPAITLCSANGIRPSVYDYLNANNTDNDNQYGHSACSTAVGVRQASFMQHEQLEPLHSRSQRPL